MKIGLSLSGCIVDLYTGVVKFEDVLVVVASCNVDPTNDTEWQHVWQGYAGQHWRHMHDDEAGVREIVLKLYNNGRLHQPRKFGATPTAGGPNWLDLVYSITGIDKYPAVQEAWNNYQTIAGLTGTGMIDDDVTIRLPREIVPRTPEQDEELRKAAKLLMGW